jgi:hypothetical protein
MPRYYVRATQVIYLRGTVVADNEEEARQLVADDDVYLEEYDSSPVEVAEISLWKS